MAPQGIVEFVPEDDSMNQREDVFDDYGYDQFSRSFEDPRPNCPRTTGVAVRRNAHLV